MPRLIPVVSLDYLLDFRSFIDKPESEEHKLKALAGVAHLQGLGRLLQGIEASKMKGVPAELLAERLEHLVAGVQTIGELITVICDSVYTEIEFMEESLNPSIDKIRIVKKRKA
jgi:hypothetical protein